MNADSATTEFPLREAQALVRPLMTPNPWIYWTDSFFMLASVGSRSSIS